MKTPAHRGGRLRVRCTSPTEANPIVTDRKPRRPNDETSRAPRLRDGARRTARGDNPPKRDGRDGAGAPDRKSTRLNSSHTVISYAVFCLKKKTRNQQYAR